MALLVLHNKENSQGTDISLYQRALQKFLGTSPAAFHRM